MLRSWLPILTHLRKKPEYSHLRLGHVDSLMRSILRMEAVAMKISHLYSELISIPVSVHLMFIHSRNSVRMSLRLHLIYQIFSNLAKYPRRQFRHSSIDLYLPIIFSHSHAEFHNATWKTWSCFGPNSVPAGRLRLSVKHLKWAD